MSTSQSDQLIRFRCECGAVLTARAKLSGRTGKCKKCGRVQEIPAASTSELTAEPPEGAIGIQEMCSVCQTAIEDDDERTTCEACKLPFHTECWEENLGCSAYGCTNVNVLKEGPDIRVGPLGPSPALALRRARRAAPPPAADDDLPWDHLLLAGAAISTVVGFVTCGAPALLVGCLAIGRIVRNQNVGESVALPVMAVSLCAVGLLAGLCLSAGFWMV